MLGADRSFTIWEVTSGALLLRVDMRARAQQHMQLRVTPGGDRIITAVSCVLGDPAIIWSASDGAVLHTLRQPSGVIRVLELAATGGALATADHAGVFVWSPRSGRLRSALRLRGGGAPSISMSSGGRFLAVSAGTPSVRVWDCATALRVRTLSLQHSARAVVLFPSGGRVLTISMLEAAVWNVSTGSRLCALQGVRGALPQRVVVSADGRTIAACGGDLSRRDSDWRSIWDAASCDLLHESGSEGAHGCSLVLAEAGTMEQLVA